MTSSLSRFGALIGACLGSVLPAQQSANPPTWSIDGQVQVGQRAGPRPLPNQWVVVHRIASDASGNVSGGPLDSARTDARGRYRIRYRRPGDQATYIAITTHHGVSYISSPLTEQNVRGDDALIMVFDTVSPPYPIRVAGRHLVIAAPGQDDSRRIVEVFELLNDSTYTVIGTENNPVWRAPVPAGARDFRIDPIGDISPAMTKQEGAWLSVFAPISPGLRQVAFSYTLGPDAFPLVMPIPDSTSVFELLVQEPDALIEGGGFTEVAPVVQDGVPFRRLLSRDVPSRAAIRFTMPRAVGSGATRGVQIVAAIVSMAMVGALGFVLWRRRRPAPTASRPGAPNAAEALVRELAMLDAEFERRSDASAAERADFDARRAALKAKLNAALADPSGAA